MPVLEFVHVRSALHFHRERYSYIHTITIVVELRDTFHDPLHVRGYLIQYVLMTIDPYTVMHGVN